MEAIDNLKATLRRVETAISKPLPASVEAVELHILAGQLRESIANLELEQRLYGDGSQPTGDWSDGCSEGPAGETGNEEDQE